MNPLDAAYIDAVGIMFPANGRRSTIVCTVPVNLKDSAPFVSAHVADLEPKGEAVWQVVFDEGVRLESEGKHDKALTRFQTALGMDPQYADAEFRSARCLLALGRPAEARDRFVRARDLDALRFRSDSAINRTVREVAAARAGEGVILADAETSFAAASPSGIPGEELFLEHVHMTFAGNYHLARTILESAAPVLDARYMRADPAAGPLTERECAGRLAYTEWNELKLAKEVREDLLTHPPFTNQLDRSERDARWAAKIKSLQTRLKEGGIVQAVKTYQAAIAEARGDWMLRMNFAQLMAEIGDVDGAAEQYQAVTARLKHGPSAPYKLGVLRLNAAKPAQAIDHFREAIRLDPNWSEPYYGLAEALGTQGKIEEGLAVFEERLKKEPDRAAVLIGMGTYLMRADRLDEARRRLEEALEARPGNPMPHAFLGDIAHRQGRRDDAIAHYEAALKAKPDWPELRERLALVKAR